MLSLATEATACADAASHVKLSHTRDLRSPNFEPVDMR